ncbi:hypothetical protein HMPREF3038_01938 [Akkermansia sp. KLE1797]|nr:hypothetical protein HMPREF3038_01938 [Akkermansia sp. KLE1797]KXU54663.1 hypothetical protein HMPREF3039_01135 [Akkermansia sp. KLE1798]KZA06007.1 hypothetical protein HMPREF1326_00270 [Akkermansia sp. KLE1605]
MCLGWDYRLNRTFSVICTNSPGRFSAMEAGEEGRLFFPPPCLFPGERSGLTEIQPSP